MPGTPFEVLRRFAVGELITLFQVDLTGLGGSVFYFTNNVFEERVEIKFGGNTYTHLACDMEGIEISADAGPPQPKFRIVTAGGPVAALLQNYGDLRGAKVWRLRTFAEFLDERPDGAGGVEANPSADGTAIFQRELYVVDRKTAANPTHAELQLVAPTDQEGIELPLRIVRKRWCDRVYRIWDADTAAFIYTPPEDGGCPFNAARYFTEDDVTTAVPAEDRCSKQLTGCVCRFGRAAALPISSFPGVRGAGEA